MPEVKPDDAVFGRVQTIVAQALGIPESKVTRDSTFGGDLGIDSLGHIELLMDVEDAFDICVADEDAQQWRTVGDAVTWIEKHA